MRIAKRPCCADAPQNNQRAPHRVCPWLALGQDDGARGAPRAEAERCATRCDGGGDWVGCQERQSGRHAATHDAASRQEGGQACEDGPARRAPQRRLYPSFGSGTLSSTGGQAGSRSGRDTNMTLPQKAHARRLYDIESLLEDVLWNYELVNPLVLRAALDSNPVLLSI